MSENKGFGYHTSFTGSQNSLSYKGYEWGPSTFFSIIAIVILTVLFIINEIQRRRALSLLDNGYYFVEQFVTIRRKRLVPVAPENVDASDPNNPRIINPALIERFTCSCCA